jgi:hypothetical protein
MSSKKKKMMKKMTIKERELNYLSNEEFAERFRRALLSYLNRTVPSMERDNHIEDLLAHTSSFSESITTFTHEF